MDNGFIVTAMSNLPRVMQCLTEIAVVHAQVCGTLFLKQKAQFFLFGNSSLNKK